MTERADTRDARDGRRPIALTVGVVAAVAFVMLRVVVAIGGHEPLAVDVWWHDLMLRSLTDAGIVVAWVPAIVGGTLGMIVVGVVIIALFLWRGRRWDAATVAAAMVVVVAIGAPMAAIIARTRPADSLAERMATSFPSGHTAVATTVAVILGLLLRRWYVWVLSGGWVLLMMWSRTYLQAHWLSDVVAGLLEGVAVATLVWVAVETVRDRRALRRAHTAHPSHPDLPHTAPPDTAPLDTAPLDTAPPDTAPLDTAPLDTPTKGSPPS